jgi:hypothetical protein
VTCTRPRASAGIRRTVSYGGFGWSIEGCAKAGRMPCLERTPSSRWLKFGHGGRTLARSTKRMSQPWNVGYVGGNSSSTIGANSCGWASSSWKMRTCPLPTTLRSSISYGGKRWTTTKWRRLWPPPQNLTMPEWSYNPHSTDSICLIREPALAYTWMLSSSGANTVLRKPKGFSNRFANPSWVPASTPRGPVLKE